MPSLLQDYAADRSEQRCVEAGKLQNINHTRTTAVTALVRVRRGGSATVRPKFTTMYRVQSKRDFVIIREEQTI